MATVFLAEDSRLGRSVAVKRLHADSPQDVARRFEREARVGASLNHPNIVTVYDTAIDDEGVLIVMEYVDGESLSQALARGRLETGRAVEVIQAVAAGLDHAHASGVVHRDVKPANVLLANSGSVKLVDLGIASATEGTRLTASGTVLGTPSYMAPEQLEGRATGPPADVYALAAVAFEALSGDKARPGNTPLEIAHQVVSQPPPDIRQAWPEAPREVADVLARGMARDQRERPRSAGVLATELCKSLEPGKGADPTMRMAAMRPTAPRARPTPAPPARSAQRVRPAPAPAPRPPRTPPPARPQPASRGGGRSLRPWLVGAAALAALVAVAVILSSGGGDGGNRDERASDRAAERAAGGSGQATETPPGEQPPAPAEPTEPEPTAPAPEEPGGEADVPASTGNDPARGTRLNDRGKALLDSGQPEEAVPVLERSVASFPEDSDDINYAYALFNLGNALRLSGRPDEAIPVLERRLEFPDQQDAVARELDLARGDAGVE